MAAKISKANFALLNEVVEELGNSIDGIVYLDNDRYAKLAEQNLIEFNFSMTDENGNVATRLTNTGRETMGIETKEVESVKNESAAVTEEKPKATRATVSREDIALAEVEIPIPEPEKAERGARSRYPFAELEVNQSFFVADSDNGQPRFRNMKATVSKRNKDNELAGKEERYTVRNIQDGAPWGEQYAGKTGAGVWRIK